MTDYARELGVFRVLVNLLGQNLDELQALQLPAVELVHVRHDAQQAPMLLVLEAIVRRTAEAQVFWARSVPALIAEDYDEEERLYQFLLRDHRAD